MKPYTANTITDPKTLRAALADIRQKGYVICPGHIHIDATGIAVPVLDRTGNVVAAISAVVPHEPQAIQTLTVLQAAARGIRRALSTPEDGQGLLNDG
jgi:DNA-binding IclR family transcriptional regulator